MFYQFLKILAAIATSIFYRKIHYYGKENLKTNRATLIACNHPSGFAEPIILACLFRSPLHFIVRGDMFNNKWLLWLLTNTNQIPIFRFKDGIKALRNNKKYLNVLKDKLIAGERILIFVEGSTIMEHQLRPLQKGIARMAQDALSEQSDMKIDILPVGINFSDSPSFRSDVMVSIGEPLTLDHSFVEGDVKLNIKHFTHRLFDLMKEHIIHLDNLENKKLLRQELIAQEIKHFKSIPPIWYRSRDQLTESIAIANEINQGTFIPRSKQIPVSNVRSVILFVAAIFALPGFLLYAIPAYSIRTFLKSKVKKIVFYSSIAIACILVMMLIYHILIGSILFSYGYFPWIFVMILSGVFTLWYYDLWQLSKKIKVNNETINC